MSRLNVLLPLAVLGAATGVAAAQPAPKFEYGKVDDVKDVKDTVWTATAEGAVAFATGNTRTTTLTGGMKATRKQAKNKFGIEASGNLVRTSKVRAIAGALPPISADEVERVSETSAKNYATKARYDRFLTEHNSLFIAALAAADPLAGKDFVGGGQVGYARQMYKTEQHETSGEFGYDFSYENFTSADAASVQIHSARAFLGHKAKLSDATSFDGSVEVLDNLNSNSAADRFDDLRINVATSLNTKLTSDISFSFSFAAKFDNVPAPIGDIGGVPIDPTNPPENSKIDTITKASLIITLL